MKIFNNFTELQKQKPELAQALLKDVRPGEWQDKDIIYFENKADFAEYELTEGWYTNSIPDADYNGAPDPFDFIDLERLGDALIDAWDPATNWTDGEAILQTNYGWKMR